jgi:hypothetical protein
MEGQTDSRDGRMNLGATLSRLDLRKDTVYTEKMIDIEKREEPDSSLFESPADYKIILTPDIH